MITGIGCFDASALRRSSPIADAIALRCRIVASRPLRHPGIQSRTVAIEHQRDGSLRSGDPITASAVPRTIESP